MGNGIKQRGMGRRAAFYRIRGQHGQRPGDPTTSGGAEGAAPGSKPEGISSPGREMAERRQGRSGAGRSKLLETFKKLSRNFSLLCSCYNPVICVRIACYSPVFYVRNNVMKIPLCLEI
jgi:hypothetical protein